MSVLAVTGRAWRAVAPGLLVVVLGAAIAVSGVPPVLGAAAVAAALLLAAAFIWALVDLERFVLIAVFGLQIYPLALIHPGGARVAIADILLVLALGAWLVRAAVGAAPRPFLAGNRLLAPALLFTAVTAGSLAWSVEPAQTLKKTVQILEIVTIMPIVFASMPSSLRDLRRGMLAYIGLSTVLAILIAVLFLPRALSGVIAEQYLLGLGKNASGSFIGVGFVLAYGLSLAEPRRSVRRVLAVLALIELAGLVATLSRGAIIGSFVGVLVVTLLLRRRRVLTIAIVAIISLGYYAVIASKISAEKLAAGGYSSSSVRVYAFSDAVHKIEQRPLLGTGAGTYWDYISPLQIGLQDPDNMFLLTGAELGIVGLAALLFLLYRFARLVLLARSLALEGRVLALAAAAGSLSLLVHFQVDVTWTRGTATLAFILMGILLAALRLSPPEKGGPLSSEGVTLRMLEAAPSPAVDPAPSSALPSAWSDRPPAPSVLHVVSSSAYAGIERHVVRLVRELRARGCAAEIACPPSAAQLRRVAAASGIPIAPLSHRGWWLGVVARRLVRFPPDLVHVHDGRAAILVGLLAKLAGRPVLRTQHFVRPASAERTGWRRRGSLALHRAANRRLDAYVAVSRSAAEAACSRGETGEADVVVIPPGIDLPSEEAVRQAAIERLGLERPVIAYVGRLETEKRLELLLTAVPQVLELVPDCSFVIAGAGGEQQRLRLLAAQLEIETAVSWTGEVGDAWAVLRAAHVYVNPSASEGFGLATVEAMALGLPVVAVAAGASAEIVLDGETGLLVAADRPDALAQAIARLASDREWAARLGVAARRRAAALYGIDRTAEQTLALYRRVQRAARA